MTTPLQQVIAKRVEYFISGPNASATVYHFDDILPVINVLCARTGDDPDEYTATDITTLPAQGAVMEGLSEVLAEVERATRKFPTWPTDPLHALGVLHEEVGELSKEVLQLVYEPHKSSAADVEKEAIQAAAMALRFVASLKRYRYERGPQHE